MVVRLVNLIFKSKLKDIMSGYRAFNRDFVRKVPIVSRGFEVETEMTLKALYYDFVIAEVPVPYRRSYLETGRIERFPCAIPASEIMIVSVICAAMGIILDAINHRLRELIRINVAHRLRPDRKE